MDADDILQKLGLKYEDLKSDERDTYNTWLQAKHQATITLEDVKDYIIFMRESVEDELSKHDNSKTQDLLLKARLRNYRLLEAFFNTPQRAQKALEKSLKGVNR